jgi:multiple sugar transport system permease protein
MTVKDQVLPKSQAQDEVKGRSKLPTWITSKMVRDEAIAGYVFILPWFLGLLIFSVGPVVASFVLMFMHWEVLTPPKFAGLDNFQRLLADPLFIKSLTNTAIYTIFAVPLQLLMALFAALLLNINVRGTNIYRTLLYLPTQMPVAASSILWFFIFSPTYGLANQLIGSFGIPPQKWLFDTQLVKPAMILMATWGFGNAMIIFLAGLKAVPEVLYEAAKIDGGGSWQLLRYITLPMISPTIMFNLVIGLIGAFQVFTSVFILTNGGPGNASLMLNLYIYNNAFQNFRMGYASVLAWVLFAFVMILTIIQLRLSKRWVYYEGEVK